MPGRIRRHGVLTLLLSISVPRHPATGCLRNGTFEVRGDEAASKNTTGDPSYALSKRSSVQSGREDFVWRLKFTERFRPGESGTGLRRWGWRSHWWDSAP